MRVEYKLKTAFLAVAGSNSTHKLILPMTRGPTNSCINFHCNKICATWQILLNPPSEYKGGQLCFFVNDELRMIPRKLGSLVQHPPKILHGVTSIAEGASKCLLVADNNFELDSNGLIEVTGDHVVSFLANRASSFCAPSNEMTRSKKRRRTIN